MTKTQAPVRIVIADDYEFFREGFKTILKKKGPNHFIIVGEAENGIELIAEVEAKKPDIIFTDVKMPIMDGLQATRIISNAHPEIGIIALTMFDECSIIYDMFESGAKGYLIKNTNIQEVTEAVETVSKGSVHYCSHTSTSLIKKLGPSKYNVYKKTTGMSFNEIEMKVIKQICRQMTTKEIADLLHLSARSVEEYSKKIKEKLEAKNIVGIALMALKNNIVRLDEL